MPTLVRTCVALVLTAVCASGCASTLFRASLSGETEAPPYFLGAGFDAICVVAPALDDPVADEASKLDTAAWAMLAPACLLDLPFSVTLDTLMLPVDAWSHRRYERPRRVPTKVPGDASSSPDRAG